MTTRQIGTWWGGVQRHDPGAAGRLVERYAGWIQQVVRRWLSDIRDLEEVTQDVLFTATQKIGQFDGRAAFSTCWYDERQRLRCIAGRWADHRGGGEPTPL